MESDAVKQWLNQMVEKSDQTSVNNWTIQIVFKKVARFLTAAVVIATVFISIGILISRGWVCYSKYRTNETMIKERIRSTSAGAEDATIPFIDFIACPAYKVGFKFDVLEKYGLKHSNYIRHGHFNPSANKSVTFDLRKIFDDITYNVTELLYQVEVITLDRNHRIFTEYISKSIEERESITISTKYSNNLGRCFSVRPKPEVVKKGILSVAFTSYMDTYIYIGYPGQFMYNTRTRAVVRLGESIYLDFSHSLSVNTIEDSNGHRCDARNNRNFDNNWYEHLAVENERTFGCSVPFHPLFYTKEMKEIEICRNPNLGANATRQFVDNKDSPWTEESVPCAWYDINLGIPDVSKKGNENTNSSKGFIKFYLKTKIKQKSIVIYYDSTTLAAEIGGYVGMFLGISLVDVAIMFDSGFHVMIKRILG